ncbi:basic salivary proline-rich protein 2-like [Salarias fasciatus]|uniref:basic salivary proline-rich protein 2-like n=1 Tax=Salarias fasciatus TaxID=181472 RepID=UPI001176A3F4|nr:basic salivary proline-rich protein 2-like [Salarias fasciatus]
MPRLATQGGTGKGRHPGGPEAAPEGGKETGRARRAPPPPNPPPVPPPGRQGPTRTHWGSRGHRRHPMSSSDTSPGETTLMLDMSLGPSAPKRARRECHHDPVPGASGPTPTPQPNPKQRATRDPPSPGVPSRHPPHAQEPPHHQGAAPRLTRTTGGWDAATIPQQCVSPSAESKRSRKDPRETEQPLAGPTVPKRTKMLSPVHRTQGRPGDVTGRPARGGAAKADTGTNPKREPDPQPHPPAEEGPRPPEDRKTEAPGRRQDPAAPQAQDETSERPATQKGNRSGSPKFQSSAKSPVEILFPDTVVLEPLPGGLEQQLHILTAEQSRQEDP